MKSFTEPRLGVMTIVGVLSLMLSQLCCPDAAMAAGRSGRASAVSEQSAKVEAALAAGRKALADHRWQEAANQFQIALGAQPDNQEAIDGLREAQIQLNEATTSQDIGEMRRQQHERAVVEFNESYKLAQDRLKAQDFSGANEEIVAARVKLDARRDFLSEGEYTKMRGDADRLIAQIETDRQAFELHQREITQNQAERDRIAQQRKEKEARQQDIDQKLKRVRQLQLELKYKEALQVIDEILYLDDLNYAALALRDTIQSTMIYREYGELQRRKEMGFSQIATGNQKSLVLPQVNITGPGDKSINALLTYPEDWPQLSHYRTGGLAGDESPENRAVWKKIQETRMPFDFNNNSFEQVKGYLENVTNLNIYVDWKALSNSGVERNAPINLKLQDVPVSAALDRILEQLGDGDQRPRYDVQNGILMISSDEAMRKRVVLRVYDIRDLLLQVPVFDNAPSLELENALNQGQNRGGGGGGSAGGGNGGGGGNGNIFGDAGDENPRVSREELVKQIVDIIQDSVDRDGWRDLGGDTGSLQELNGNLIITQTPINHRSIEGLLAQLREIRALQINVESRFLTVSTDWFEKIGVDLDLYFNTNNDMFNAAKAVDPNFHLSDFFGPDGRVKDPLVFGSFDQVTNNNPPFNTVPTGGLIGVPDATGQNIQYLITPVGAPIRTQSGFAPVAVSQNSLSLVDQLADFDAASFAGVATGNPALTVGLQFLDDIQVDLLIQATQADRRSVVLTAPRLTFFNGQRAWVAVTTQTAFVSALTAVTGDSSGAFQPTVSQLSDGFVLDVEGVISADRRYVTMTVIFDFAEFLGFRQSDAAEVTGSAGGGGTTGGNATNFTGFVELPQIRVSQIRTTVSVPDKGTVLLGGQRHVEEIEVETGVPVLSKIPFLNRFFTNRVSSKDEETLLILIRPEIIIQQENEDLLFPGLNDTLGSGAAYIR